MDYFGFQTTSQVWWVKWIVGDRVVKAVQWVGCGWWHHGWVWLNSEGVSRREGGGYLFIGRPLFITIVFVILQKRVPLFPEDHQVRLQDTSRISRQCKRPRHAAPGQSHCTIANPPLSGHLVGSNGYPNSKELPLLKRCNNAITHSPFDNGVAVAYGTNLYLEQYSNTLWLHHLLVLLLDTGSLQAAGLQEHGWLWTPQEARLLWADRLGRHLWGNPTQAPPISALHSKGRGWIP